MSIYPNKKAQSTAEYVIVLGLIVAAVVAMQTYIKRGFQGRMKEATDYVDNAGGQGVVAFTGNLQYEPYYLSSDFASQRTSGDSEAYAVGGSVARASNDSSTRTGTQTIAADTNP